MKITNKFGTGELETIYDLFDRYGNVYVISESCMSVTSEILSVASYEKYKNNFVSNIDSITDLECAVVLGCQLTDLAILNSLRTMESLHKLGNDTAIYAGGCLAQRFDIELPDYVKRIDVNKESVPLTEEAKTLVQWSKPFWADDWKKEDSELSYGHLFRERYMLRIGSGSSDCATRSTNFSTYEANAFSQVEEFISNENVVLISDSPTEKQIKDWCEIAIENSKPLSFRNVKPEVAILCMSEFENLSTLNLLDILHCPISYNGTEDLGVLDFVTKAQALRNKGTKVTADVTTDYELLTDEYTSWLNDNFDYWCSIPYFDGVWNREVAESKWAKIYG